jgi:hypothetical protein
LKSSFIATLLTRQLTAGYNEADMLIQGAFMHVHESVTADQFLKFLADEAPGGHYFVAQPPPGIIMTAAIDWRVIVPDSDSLDALATALWSGYESLVKPLQNGGGGSDPLIFIQIKNLRGECDQFTLGKDVDKKDGFFHRMKESAAILSPKNKKSAVKQEIENTNGSDYWIQVVC